MVWLEIFRDPPRLPPSVSRVTLPPRTWTRGGRFASA